METHMLMLVAIFGVISFSQASLPHTQCKRTYEKVDGFIENGDNRVLPELLINDRDVTSDENDGHVLDWNQFEASVHSLACRCAAKAKEKGYKVFALQFFGECWSGPTAELNYAKYGKAEDSKSYQFIGNPPPPCVKSKEQECVGGPFINYVYRLKDEPAPSIDVDGGYSKWSDWTSCSKTCGGGVRGRERTCTNPKPEGKGKDCSSLGPAEETASCAEKACPVPAVDGNWSPWKPWTACSATCGGGVRVRERLCNNPAPQGAGKKCVGDAEQSEACAQEACPIPCVKALDIGIILDASGSVRAHNFRIALNFIQDLIKHFQVSPQGTHFGFIIYSGSAKLEFKMSDSRYHNFNSITARIRSTRYTGGWTRTDRALEIAASHLFTPAGGDRSDKDNILIVFTDGKTNRGSKPYPQVLRPLQAKHVRTVAVGIGYGINRNELRQIAMGDPHYVVQVNRFSDLKDKLQVILDDSCQGISPPTPEPECAVHGMALGMESGAIPDGSLSATSEWDANHGVGRGRLNIRAGGGKKGAWSARYNDKGQYFQVDFGKAVKITRVASQGRQDADQWITSYWLSYSQDDGLYDAYTPIANKGKQIIVGNKDRNTVVEHKLEVPIFARYIRVHPETWRSHISGRFEFYGCRKGFSPPVIPTCMSALGLQCEQKVPDSKMTASSEYNSGHRAANGRLYFQSGKGRTGAWSARYNNNHQWLQVDFGKVAKIQKVATQGRQEANQWVTSFYLSYSRDGIFFDKTGVYGANSDRNSVVVNSINPPIYARYVRIHPVTFYRHISMRAEFYGCTSGFVPPAIHCVAPLGMQGRTIPDSHITASSMWDANHSPSRARLGTVRVGHKTGAWSAKSNDVGQWLQIDNGKAVKITRFATQGRQDANQWVKTFSLQYSQDGSHFENYQGGKVLTGNSDRNTVVGNVLLPPIIARYIRVRPKSWNGHISMRLELYGCTSGFPLPPTPSCLKPLGVQSKAIPDSQMSASSELNAYYGAKYGRLHLQKSGRIAGSWTALRIDRYQWIGVDFGKVAKVTRISTQGSHGYRQWVTSYLLEYSLDGADFQTYTVGGRQKIFPANRDQHTVVSNSLPVAVYARYVRIRPLTWYSRISMRVDLYGCTSGPDFKPPPAPKCTSPLGLQNHFVKDSQMSASSQWSSSHRAAYARLYLVGYRRAGGWSSRVRNADQWLQIDFLKNVKVTGVATQGREEYNQWVTAYSLAYSRDGIFWDKYEQGGKVWLFRGNRDRFTVVRHQLEKPFIARYVRILPKQYYHHISMRAEVYGCREGFTVPPLPCASALGMQSRKIPDSRITVSSKWDNNHGPERARLGTTRSGHKTGAWSARSNDAGQWIQIDLGKVTKVTRIATQGRSDANQWVRTYLLQYSTDGVHFSNYGILTGNKDRNTISGHTIDPPMIARYVRVRPKTWYGHISMRFEVYGCTHDVQPSVPPCMQPLSMRDDQMSASTIWHSSHRAANGRLNFHAGRGRTGAWSARRNSGSQWLQVDFGRKVEIKRIETQGRQDANQWVRTYNVLYSNDGRFWRTYAVGGRVKLFTGNFDRYSVVGHNFEPSIVARYARVNPKSWYGHLSMRLQFYGCTSNKVVPSETCRQALGMQGKTIPDSRITASSMWDANHSPSRARLGTVRVGHKKGAWSARRNDVHQWIQVDMGRVVKVTRIATQGRQDADQWVRFYSLQYSLDGGAFKDYQGGQTLLGNSDRNSIVGNVLETAIIARYIRIRPKSWQGHISMRFEIYGCTSGFPIPPSPGCGYALGLQSHALSDSQMRASSEWNSGHRAANGRLHFKAGAGRTGAWSARYNNGEQWLQVDFKKIVMITKIATQGRQEANQWVKSYTLSYSRDGVFWKMDPEVLSGNSDRSTVVTHNLKRVIYARYLRIHPRSWQGHISLRAEVYGCTSGFHVPTESCLSALGMRGKTIPDSSITASSMWDANHSPSRARLDTVRQGHKTGAWSARRNDVHQWIQVDFSQVVKVTRIATQGRQDANQWVKSYSVQYSLDGGSFKDYKGGQVLMANIDRNSIVGNILEPVIIARYIRIRPKTWYGHVSLRFEMYGCTSGFPIPPSPSCGHALGLQSQLVSDSQMRASSEWNSGHRAANGRLHFKAGAGRTGAWSARYNNGEQWLQVDFKKIVKITKIATQGRQEANQWVKSYTLSYSRDGVFWKMDPEVLSGNSDRSTVVTHNLKRVIYARYLRIHPRSWQGHISLRAEVYGCTSGFHVPTESCLSALGMRGKTIPDSSITASSMWDVNHSPSRARLDTVRQGHKTGAWSAKRNDVHQWIQVDMGRVAKVRGIATQGRQDANQWVRSYSVQYSLDGGHFENYKGGQVLKANGDRNTIVGHILEPAIIARYIRIRPKTWYGHVSMRFEIFGCTSGFPIPPTPSCAGAIDLADWMMSSSSDWDYNHRAANGKLNFVSGGGRTGAWSARYNNANQWLLVDFGREMKITRISTQGRHDNNQWVRTYTVEYSQDGVRFSSYRVGGAVKTFTGNSDRSSVVSHKLPTPIVAQYVRLRPKSWYAHISMRLGMYGCPTGKKPASPPCHQAMDVGIIMDRSGSIGAENFRRSQDFVARLISHFEYASSGTRFGVIAYNTVANVIFKFNDAAVQNPKALMSRVYGIRYLRGGTRTDRALQVANSYLYSSRGGYRSNVPNVLFVLTDGKTNRGSLPYSTVLRPLLAKKVKLIAVGVGNGINNSELRQISSKHVFHVKDFKVLSEKLKDILDASCPNN